MVERQQAHIDALVAMFKVLGDRTRLNILLILARGERNVGSLCTELGLPQPTVSHHLGLMRINRLIDNRRDGKQVYYELADGITVESNGQLRILVDQNAIELHVQA